AFTALEAIEMTAKAGGSVIEFFPGQSFSKENKNRKFNHEAADQDDMIKIALERCAEHKITPMNYGVVGCPKDEKKAAQLFGFAKKLGLYGVTTESDDAIDTLEMMAKEFDIKVCFHNHPKRPKDPGYKVWDPKYILDLVKDRDPRVGACADTGHWMRSGFNPVDCIKILAGRVHSTHLKDLKKPRNEDVVWGAGDGHCAGQFAELRKQGFIGNVSVEYETKWENNHGDVTESIAWIKKLAEREMWG
ncbi:MAG TPA: sugar phosphate isomerase/epimerase, partial [Planctomycetia bacterium]|nr:sugar phosphate isomerase/epimerase [Planctomycetia bacterium]